MINYPLTSPKGRLGVTKTNAQSSRNNNVPLRLVVSDNQEADRQEDDPKMSSQGNILNKSNTQASPASFFRNENSALPSQTQTDADDKDGGSSSLHPASESPSPKLRKSREEIRQEIKSWEGKYAPPVNTEGEQVFQTNIAIRTYGKSDVALKSVLMNLGRALHHAFGENFDIRLIDGTVVIYDAKAHDGEHFGHEEVLRLMQMPNAEE